jgi:hypothetical protein
MCEMQHDHFLLLQSRWASPRHGAFELVKRENGQFEDGWPPFLKGKKKNKDQLSPRGFVFYAQI